MRIFILFFILATPRLLLAQGIAEELEMLYRIDRLPEYLDGTHVEQFSSYDHTGGNDDGFDGTYSFIRKEGDDLVIAEMKGPGVINRIWTPTPSSDTIQFFFDGEDIPQISIPFIDLFTSNNFPFLSPVCGHEIGGYYCYIPIPFKKSCKVILKGKMLFYQLQYRTYPKKTKVPSFTMDWDERERQALDRAVQIWGRSGTNYLKEIYEDVSVHETVLRISPGQTKRIFEMEKGGRIVGLEMDGIAGLSKYDNRLLIKAKWDNEEEWAINAPVKDFFGFHFGLKSMRSVLSGTSGDISYTWYPMPFSQNAVFELEYLEDEEVPTREEEIGIRVYYSEKPRDNTEGKFYSYWKRERNPREGEPYVIMPLVKGRGHYAGTILNCQGLIPGTTGYFEGDDQAIIDGQLRLHGTGSEDYFNGGWYAIPDRWDMAHSLPSHGCLGYSIPLSRTGAYRHFFADKLSFQEDFKLTIEHGPTGNKYPVDYSSVAFYYAENALSQEEPTAEMSSYPQPAILKFPGNHLNILAFTNGEITNGQRIDRQRVLILEAMENRQMQVKFRLEAPAEGEYELYCSYFKTPASGEIKFMQRQNELSDWMNLNSSKEEYIEKEYVGILDIVDGYCTVSVHVQGNETGQFVLHNFILEKNKY
jgi:hypothetical protein